ncbi:sortase [Bacillus bingmayongensis]|uniref:sortase n=1 Tax=Bacillus bingmayongensis TaxID=1150157 RepID=UPI001ED9C022|nr:sortase [Bacillus bingmayongensis]
MDTHTVLAGRCGYHDAKMFRHLDQLQNGINFYIHILGTQLTYEVTGREVINLEQIEKLVIVKGKDHTTLLSCEQSIFSINIVYSFMKRVDEKIKVKSCREHYEIKKPKIFLIRDSTQQNTDVLIPIKTAK